MAQSQDKQSREARLAEALRANLQRRKAQARAQAQTDTTPETPPAPDAPAR